VCVTILGDDSTQVEFAMRWRDFNRPQRATQEFDAYLSRFQVCAKRKSGL
jgi:hypothetical protein